MSGVGLIKAIDKRLAELELKLDVTRNADGIKTVLSHSQAHVDAGTTRQNDNGTMSSFLGRVVNREDLNEGRATIIPTFWEGKERPESEAIDMAIKSGKKWPSSDTVDGALRLETYIHDIMEQQVAQ